MIFEGVKLMVVGMTTVMLFLLLMILFINLIAILTRGSTARELAAIEAERDQNAFNRRNTKGTSAAGEADEDIAVIAAAVAAYEAERFAKA